jgi:hypothetical protein
MSIHALVLVAKLRCKKLSLGKDTKTSGVAGKRQMNPSARKDATTLSPLAWRRIHSECFIVMIWVIVFFRKGDLQRLQKCDKCKNAIALWRTSKADRKSPVISWKTSNSTYE